MMAHWAQSIASGIPYGIILFDDTYEVDSSEHLPAVTVHGAADLDPEEERLQMCMVAQGELCWVSNSRLQQLDVHVMAKLIADVDASFSSLTAMAAYVLAYF